MKYDEILKLKNGDLVITSRYKAYKGMVFVIADIDLTNIDSPNLGMRVSLKQPGFDNGFILNNVDARFLQRYESE